jgi:hypothetical protein
VIGGVYVRGPVAPDDPVHVHLNPDPEELRRARAKAWELVRSRITSEGEFEKIIFSEFIVEAMDDTPEFTFAVLGEMRRIAAAIIVNVAGQAGQSPEAVLQWANDADEEDQRGS